MIIESDVSLKEYNTLQIPVKAKYFVKIQNQSDLFELMESDLWMIESHCILGGGANILFIKDFDGIVVKIEIPGKSIILDDENGVIIEVGAGENRSDFVEWSCEQGLCGIENLIDIPGNVGTAPVSNIGAYGMEISNVIHSVEGVNLHTKEIKNYQKSECEFAYRTSIFKHTLKEDFLVTKVRFLLHRAGENYIPNIEYADIQREISNIGKIPNSPLEVSNIVRKIRANKLPDRHVIGTAGSFFSNPIITMSQRTELEKKYPDLSHHDYRNGEELMIKLSAGQLIDKCGLKGWKIKNGTAGTYEKHALILVNQGGNADDVLDAMHYIQNTVFEKFGVTLSPEVVLV